MDEDLRKALMLLDQILCDIDAMDFDYRDPVQVERVQDRLRANADDIRTFFVNMEVLRGNIPGHRERCDQCHE